MADFMTTRMVAERLGVAEWEIENIIRRREVPRPPVVGRTRVWTDDAVEQLRVALHAWNAKRRAPRARYAPELARVRDVVGRGHEPERVRVLGEPQPTDHIVCR